MAASLSHQLGGLGLLARENATIINASLQQVFSQLCDAMQEVKSSLTLDQVKFFLCSSAGTVEEITAESD